MTAPAGTPPAGTPPAGTPPAGTPPAGTPPAGTPPAAPWHGYTDAADVAYVANKGWQGPQDAVKGYREVEKLIGRDPNTLLTIPRADDPQGFLQAMDRLGRPATADKYEFDVPKGATPNTEFQTWARGTFHELGLTGPMAKQLTAKYNEYLGAQGAKLEADYNNAVAADKTALLNEWKGGHERMMNVAQAAAKAIGFDGDMIDAMESSIGYAKTMKFFADLGSKMSEDTLQLSGQSNTKFGEMLTPAEAKAQWDQKKMDPNFMAALRDEKHPGHAVAQAEQTRMFKVMYPQG